MFRRNFLSKFSIFSCLGLFVGKSTQAVEINQEGSLAALKRMAAREERRAINPDWLATLKPNPVAHPLLPSARVPAASYINHDMEILNPALDKFDEKLKGIEGVQNGNYEIELRLIKK